VYVNQTAIEISGADLHSNTNMAIEEQRFGLFPRKDFTFDLFVINAANAISTLMDPNNDISEDHYRIGIWLGNFQAAPVARVIRQVLQ
jgi:hypothetical protein